MSLPCPALEVFGRKLHKGFVPYQFQSPPIFFPSFLSFIFSLFEIGSYYVALVVQELTGL